MTQPGATITPRPRSAARTAARSARTAGDRAAVRADLAAVLAAEGGRGVIVAPGCVIRYPVDRALLAQVAADITKGTA